MNKKLLISFDWEREKERERERDQTVKRERKRSDRERKEHIEHISLNTKLIISNYRGKINAIVLE